MDGEAPAPSGLDTDAPSIARVADYLLGGKDNFAADRALVEELLTIAPEFKAMSRDYQAFNERSVRHLAQAGVRQFVNLTAKLPTRHNTHEVAQAVIPDARVAYVADDPVVLSHARAIMGRDPHTVVIEGDMRRPGELFGDPRFRASMDLDQPMAVLLGGQLQYIPDSAKPYEAVARLRDLLPAGSYLALSHVVFDLPPDLVGPMTDIYRQLLSLKTQGRKTGGTGRGRALEDVLRFFDGFDLLEPGVVYTQQWRPDGPPAPQPPRNAWLASGVGRTTAV